MSFLIPKNFTITKLLGEGSYGKVFKCASEVAIKVPHSPAMRSAAEMEKTVLSSMRDVELDTNIISLLGYFVTPFGPGLILELLDMNLKEYKAKVSPNGLRLCDVRALIRQMTSALWVLSGADLLHTDIKPDNIMVCDHRSGSLQLKLIDFGVSEHRTQVKPGSIITSLPYRSPEVLLGLDYNAGIDMWSLGVSVVNLMLDRYVFKPYCVFEAMRCIVYLVGSPTPDMLRKSLETPAFFVATPNGWRIKTNEEYLSLKKYYNQDYSSMTSLWQRLRMQCEMDELESCIDLLKKMLDVNEATRITPTQVRQHPFILASREEGEEEEETDEEEAISETDQEETDEQEAKGETDEEDEEETDEQEAKGKTEEETDEQEAKGKTEEETDEQGAKGKTDVEDKEEAKGETEEETDEQEAKGKTDEEDEEEAKGETDEEDEEEAKGETDEESKEKLEESQNAPSKHLYRPTWHHHSSRWTPTLVPPESVEFFHHTPTVQFPLIIKAIAVKSGRIKPAASKNEVQEERQVCESVTSGPEERPEIIEDSSEDICGDPTHGYCHGPEEKKKKKKKKSRFHRITSWMKKRFSCLQAEEN